jgi:predicted transcriptional regulator
MDQISEQEVSIYRMLSTQHEWFDSGAIVRHCDMARRTVNRHLAHWAKLGLVERAAVYPGYRYRWVEQPPMSEYLLRLVGADGILRQARIPAIASAEKSHDTAWGQP